MKKFWDKVTAAFNRHPAEVPSVPATPMPWPNLVWYGTGTRNTSAVTNVTVTYLS